MTPLSATIPAVPSPYWKPKGQFHIIAHRGASALAPENSVAAVSAAAECGATDVEVDLHCTADGHFVIRHDATFPAVPEYISQIPFAKYKALCETRTEICLTLEELLDTVRSLELGLYLDMKSVSQRRLPYLMSAVAKSGLLEKTVFAGTRYDILREAKKELPACTTAALYRSPATDIISIASWIGAEIIHPCFESLPDPAGLLTPKYLNMIRSAGAGVVTWNVTDQSTAQRLLELDLLGACADDPRMLLASKVR